MRDLYRVLGVRWDAAQEEIHGAYRQKAKILHPDTGGSIEAFRELARAYDILSDTKRRERYDRTGEVEPILPNNLDANATEVIAQKLGVLLHAEQDLTFMDVAALLEEAIHEDIIQRRTHIANQRRAVDRVTRLRGRVKRRANGEDNQLARILDWHERSAKYLIKKHEAAVQTMERALEILQDYSFGEDLPITLTDDLSVALHDVLQSLKQAGQSQPGRC